jgi:hypothetical protein
VAADIEAVALVLRGPRQAANLLGVLFDNGQRDVVLQQLIGGGEAGGAGAHDDDVPALAFGDQSCHRVSTVVTS